MSTVEHSHPWYRASANNAIEVRAAGRFTANEVREIMARTDTRDLRQLGCPEWIFLRVLESRAKKINFRSMPAPAPESKPDLADRLDSVSLF